MRTMKFNPSFLSDDELTTSFCVRTEEFDSIMEMLRECSAASNPHRLIVGPRGSGKTTLLLRVAAELRKNADLSRSFLPIVFAEESYSISSAGEFWLEALVRLAEQAPDEQDREELNAAYNDIRQTRDESVLGQRCLATILEFADRHGMRLLLVVENLNMIFSQLLDQKMEWELRKVLQTESRILLLASASSRFDEIDNPDRAFFDLFVTHTLLPLNTGQCAELWRSVTGHQREPESMRGIQILTGGSPRFLAILARFGAELSFGSLISDLHNLIDDLTEYFKYHLEALPPQERRVYVSLLEIWEPAASRQVADHARLDVNKCSALLNRLTARGIVQVTSSETRRKLYYSSERLYNIFFLLRNSHSSTPLIAALIKFIDGFYSISDVKKLGMRMISELSNPKPERKDFQWKAFGKLIELSKLEPYREEMYLQVAELAPDYIKEKFAVESSESKHKTRSGKHRQLDFGQFFSFMMTLKASTHAHFEQYEETVTACDNLFAFVQERGIDKFPGPYARCLALKALALLVLEREQNAAFDCLNEAVDRFRSSSDPEVRLVVYSAVLALSDIERQKGNIARAINEAEWLFDQIDNEYPSVKCQTHMLRGSILADGGDPTQAEADFAEALKLLPESVLEVGIITDRLVDYAILLGIGHVLNLIEQSPSAELLRPLTVALEKELGKNPLVSIEIEEVAEDIRKDLRERLKAAPGK